jgi:hypothetical protein
MEAGWSGVRSGGGIDVVMTYYVLEVVCSIKNRVFAVCVCVCVCVCVSFRLYAFFNCLVYVIFLNCVHHLSFICNLHNFRCVVYASLCVSCIEYELTN